MEKCYVFVNYYVQGRQVGIQAAHAVARLCRNTDIHVSLLVDEWMKHETLVVLNGGDSNSMSRLLDKFVAKDPEGAVAEFHEHGMDGLMTAFAYIPSASMASAITAVRMEIGDENLDDDAAEIAYTITTARSHKG
jgi:hypothetical protein